MSGGVDPIFSRHKETVRMSIVPRRKVQQEKRREERKKERKKERGGAGCLALMSASDFAIHVDGEQAR